MSLLLLSILCSTAIYTVFKLFNKFGINTFHAIVINYFVASGFGFAYAGFSPAQVLNPAPNWLPIALIVGVLFISLFYLMARTTQIHGVAVTGIASKMSLIIPVVFFIATDSEEGASVTKILGVGLGVAGIVLASSGKTKKVLGLGTKLMPFILFMGSGLLDLLLAFAEKNYLNEAVAYKSFVPVPFMIAGIIGLPLMAFPLIAGRTRFEFKSLLAGIFLGLINYGSIYFLLKVLGMGIMDRSTVIPINNIGVVVGSALVGILAFKEATRGRKLVGILLSIVSILLLSAGVFL